MAAAKAVVEVTELRTDYDSKVPAITVTQNSRAAVGDEECATDLDDDKEDRNMSAQSYALRERNAQQIK